MELYRGLLPGLSTIPQAMIIGISSPYKRSGLLFERWRKHFGQDSDDVFVIQAASHIMNPVLDTRDRDRQMEEDPTAARSEWFAQWREDLVSFVDPATVDRCVIKHRIELPPQPDIQYAAAFDPSGGSGDSMTLAISHADGQRAILDLVAEWVPPFNPDLVVGEIAGILRRYRINTVVGDAFGGIWVLGLRCPIRAVDADALRGLSDAPAGDQHAGHGRVAGSSALDLTTLRLGTENRSIWS